VTTGHRSVLFVSHDASRTGAPMLLLHLLGWLRAEHPEVRAQVLLLRGGALRDSFAALASTKVVPAAGTGASRSRTEATEVGLDRLGAAGASTRLHRARLQFALRGLEPFDLAYLSAAPSLGLLDVLPAGVPVLGVNVGQLGYLSAIEPEGLEGALDAFFDGRFLIEERMLVGTRVAFADGRPDEPETEALNEIVIEKTPMGHTVRLAVSLDGEFFTTYAADGLIVATPTGSTAYSFSARGPIVAPGHRALIMTPVSPHMLFDRALVLEPSTEVRIAVLGPRPAMLSADGRAVATLEEGDAVVCTASSHSARLVRFDGSDFHRVLKSKFGLNDR